MNTRSVRIVRLNSSWKPFVLAMALAEGLLAPIAPAYADEDSNLAKLVAALNKANDEVESLRVRVRELEGGKSDAGDANSLCQAQLQKIIIENTTLKHEYEDVERDAKGLQDQVTAVTGELENCRAREGQARDSFKDCSRDLTACESQLGSCPNDVLDELRNCGTTRDWLTRELEQSKDDLRNCREGSDAINMGLEICVREKDAIGGQLQACKDSERSISCEKRISEMISTSGACGEVQLKSDDGVLHVSGAVGSEDERDELLDKLRGAYSDFDLDTSDLVIANVCRKPLIGTGLSIDTDNNGALLSTINEILDRASLVDEARCREIGEVIEAIGPDDLPVERIELHRYWVRDAEGYPVVCRKEDGEWISRPRSPTESTDRLPVFRIVN